MDVEKILSVVVPVYNAENYLSQCIESILNQTLKNIEIILIDDGSNDCSGEICEQYAKRDCRIKLFHQSNSGLVSARQLGMSKSTCKYITFVDSDDWIEKNMYSKLMEHTFKKNYDLITSDIFFEYENDQQIERDAALFGDYNEEDIKTKIVDSMVYDYAIGCSGILSSVCCKVFDRELLKKSSQNIDYFITYGEDGALVYPFLLECKSLYITHFCGYHYRQYNESMIHTVSVESFDKIFKLSNYFKYIIDNKKVSSTTQLQLKVYIYSFITPLVKEVYQIDYRNDLHLFPFEIVPVKSKVVMYGSGTVGRMYMECISCTKYVEIVAWIDQNHDEERKIFNSDKIRYLEYDYIIIAVYDLCIANEIIEKLLLMGVIREKIIWKKPSTIRVGWI